MKHLQQNLKMENNRLPYPFDMIDPNKRYCISRKLAKALIVKFLKRERIFKELVTECLLYHRHLKTVDDVLENMTHPSQLLYECLFYSKNIFSWEGAKWYHIGNEDYYWTELKEKWENLVGHQIMISYK